MLLHRNSEEATVKFEYIRIYQTKFIYYSLFRPIGLFLSQVSSAVFEIFHSQPTCQKFCVDCTLFQ